MITVISNHALARPQDRLDRLITNHFISLPQAYDRDIFWKMMVQLKVILSTGRLEH